jgi:hypothetical protein
MNRNYARAVNRFGHTWLESSAGVVRVVETARGPGALDVNGPKAMPYAPGHYAA